MSYSASFGGFARSKTLRAQWWPCFSTLSFKAWVTRMSSLASSASPGAAGGLPRGRFGVSMVRL